MVTARNAFLRRRNPLAKAAGPAPAMLFLIFTRDPWTPATFLLASLALIITGAGLGMRRNVQLLGGFAAALVVMTAGFTVLMDAGASPSEEPLLVAGPLTVDAAAVHHAAASATRSAAILGLALIGGLTTTGPELVRALVTHLRVPYRIGYAALAAAYRFVPRFQHELSIIRAAHRMRGAANRRGPIAAARRSARYAVPLLAGGIRHGERVAVAMDARGFGAHPTRTERYPSRFTPADWTFVAVCWLVSAGFVATSLVLGLLAPLSFV